MTRRATGVVGRVTASGVEAPAGAENAAYQRVMAERGPDEAQLRWG